MDLFRRLCRQAGKILFFCLSDAIISGSLAARVLRSNFFSRMRWRSRLSSASRALFRVPERVFARFQLSAVLCGCIDGGTVGVLANERGRNDRDTILASAARR